MVRQWTIVLLSDAEGRTETIGVTDKEGDDVIRNVDGSVAIRRGWAGSSLEHTFVKTYSAWRVSQVEEVRL